MSDYKISFIRQGRDADYIDFWDRGLHVNSKGEKLNSDLVGFTAIVKADSLGHAIEKAGQLHPDLHVATQHCAKVG